MNVNSKTDSGMNFRGNSHALSYLILLLDALGIPVSRENCAYWWRTITAGTSVGQTPPDDQILESMIFLWNIRKTMPTSSCPGEPIPEIIDQADFVSEPEEQQEPKEFVDSAVEAAAGLPSKMIPDLPVSTDIENSEPETIQNGRYIYGIVRSNGRKFDTLGIDGQPVWVIECGEIGAIVHACQSSPYDSPDQSQVAEWLSQHQKVLEVALGIYSSLIPMSFDVIIDGNGADPDQLVVNWLHEHFQAAVTLLEKLAGKAEYGVRVTCPVQLLEKKAETEDPSIARLTQRLAGMSPGKAYLYKTQLASMLRTAVHNVKNGLAGQIKQRLAGLDLEIKDSNTNWKPANQEEILIANLVVLASIQDVEALGQILEDCQDQLQVTVQFTGPWPAYSFTESLD